MNLIQKHNLLFLKQKPGVNMYSVVRRQRHSSGSSNDGLYVVQATTYHDPNMDSATADLFANSGVMNQEGPALLPSSPDYGPPPPPNTLASEAPEFRVQLRDTITSFLENADLTSETPLLEYSEEQDEIQAEDREVQGEHQVELQGGLATPRKALRAALVSSALKSFTLTSPAVGHQGLVSLNVPSELGDRANPITPSSSKVTRRQSGLPHPRNLEAAVNAAALTPPSPVLPTIPEKSPITSNTSSPSPNPTSASSSRHGTGKRRRLDSSAESVSPPSSNLNPNAAVFTPGSVETNAVGNTLGARPKIQTGRPLFKRPKKKGASLG